MFITPSENKCHGAEKKNRFGISGILVDKITNFYVRFTKYGTLVADKKECVGLQKLSGLKDTECGRNTQWFSNKNNSNNNNNLNFYFLKKLRTAQSILYKHFTF